MTLSKLFSLSLVLLALSAIPASAGGYKCTSGECWTTIQTNQGCLKCVINPAPAYCSCSTLGSCPQVSTQCGNGSTECGNIVCSDVCPGCRIPFTCPPGSRTTPAGYAFDFIRVPPVQPTFATWINSQSLLDGVSSASPLMAKVVLHMRDVKEQWACSHLVGLVVDLDSPSHLQSKLIVHSNERGITTFTIFNDSTGQDEILSVNGLGNSWTLSTNPSYASETATSATTLAEGSLNENSVASSSLASSGGTTVAPIHPTISKWIGSKSLLDGVSAVSPLMKQVLLQTRQDRESWDSSYLTGLVIDPNDSKHLQSKFVIHSTEAGITIFTIINRSTGRDEILVVHGPKDMWSMRTQPSFASASPQSPEIVGHGNLNLR